MDGSSSGVAVWLFTREKINDIGTFLVPFFSEGLLDYAFLLVFLFVTFQIFF